MCNLVPQALRTHKGVEMSSKAVIYDFKVMDAVSATVAQISKETVVGQLDKLSYHCKFSVGTASGEFIVEAKNGLNAPWYPLNFGTLLTITSQAEVLINLSELNFQFIRLKWGGDAAATGTLTVVVAAKAVGT